MTNNVLLTSKDHGHLKVRVDYSPELGDNLMWVPTFAHEFKNIQAHYPILYHRNGISGEFSAIALLGLENGENLFIRDGKWDAAYTPLMMQRIPFSIGLYDRDQEDPRRLIHIDLDHPKVTDKEGASLFDSAGRPTKYLNHISGVLEAIHLANQTDKHFKELLLEADLLEQASIDITLEDGGGTAQLLGFYAINESRLSDLTEAQLVSFHKAGLLEPLYMAVASLPNIRRLMERKSAQRTGDAVSV